MDKILYLFKIILKIIVYGVIALVLYIVSIMIFHKANISPSERILEKFLNFSKENEAVRINDLIPDASKYDYACVLNSYTSKFNYEDNDVYINSLYEKVNKKIQPDGFYQNLSYVLHTEAYWKLIFYDQQTNSLSMSYISRYKIPLDDESFKIKCTKNDRFFVMKIKSRDESNDKIFNLIIKDQ